MDDLESQIAKIQLGNFRSTNSYAYALAEKAGGGDAEIYVVAELPLFNPAAEESCEKICLAIASTLRRAYKKPFTENIFENAIAQMNEELGKLASLGQIHWINKLNCVVAVKEKSSLTIASCGKVAAFLLRNGELTDISCSADSSHPLKTFENYATGKIRLGDLIIFSNNQLFNYVSMDRLRSILTGSDFLAATQTIIELLKETAGPEVAFATLLNLQVKPGETANEEIDLESYVVEATNSPSWSEKAFSFLKSLLALDHSGRQSNVGLPKVSFNQRLKNVGSGAGKIIGKGKSAWTAMGRGLAAGKQALNLQNYKNFSPQKKFFLISAIVLLLAFAINVIVTAHYKNVKTRQEKFSQTINQVLSLTSNAEGSLLYNDGRAALDFLKQAESLLPGVEGLNKDNKTLRQTAYDQIAELKNKMEKVTKVEAQNLGNLGGNGNLIKMPKFLGVYVNGQIISYNKETGQVEDGVVKSIQPIEQSVAIKDSLAVIYNKSSLLAWNTSNGDLGTPFNQSLPEPDGFGGLKYYPTNSRVYVLDKSAGQVISYIISSNKLSRPVVSLSANPETKDAIDFAIDGSIFILNKSGIVKYSAGKLSEFNQPFLFTPFSGNGKIYTEVGFNNLYILDAGAGRVLITDKRGNLLLTITSDQFTKLTDFTVDEKTNTIYLLNDGSLLKVNF